MTHGEQAKIQVDNLTLRFENALMELGTLNNDHKQTLQMLNDLRRDHQAEIVALKCDVAELKKGHDTWGHRLWMVAVAIASASIGAVITYLLKK